MFLIALALVVGVLLRREPGRWVRNPRPHRAADEDYYLVEIHGRQRAFTLEALEEAEERAKRLKFKS